MSDQKYNLSARVSIYADVKDIKKAETQIERLTRSIEELDEVYQENIASQENVREAMRKLHKEGREGGEEWEGLHRDLERLSTTMLEMREAMIGYSSEMQGAQEATDQQRISSQKLAAEMEDLAAEQQNSNDIARSSKDRLEHLNKANEQAAIATQRRRIETEKSIVKSKASSLAMIDEAKYAHRLAKEGQFLGVAMGDMRKSLVQALSIGGVAGLVFKGINLIEDGLRSAIEAAKEFQRQSIETFSSLEEEIARTQAQVQDFNLSTEEAYAGILSVSKEMKRGPLEAQETLRRLLNLGLTTTEAYEAMEASSKAARVANADLMEVAITATNTFNAYGGEVYTVAEVLDYFAFITQNSNLEFSDLITNMTRIISPAAEAGVMLNEVAAAMIIMNRQGDDMNEIGELLGLTLTQLNIPTTQLGQTFTDAAGVSFPQFIKEGGNLIEGLILIDDHVEELGVTTQEAVIGLSKFFRDAQAGRGAVELMGRHTQELGEAFDDSATAVGALDEQYEYFKDTLYILNEELEATKEQTYAVEGSLTSSAAKGWVNFKIAIQETLGGLSEAIATFKILKNAIKESDYGLGVVEIDQALLALLDPEDVDYEEKFHKYRKYAAEIIRNNADISKEQLLAAVLAIVATKEQLALDKQIAEEREKALKAQLEGNYAQRLYADETLDSIQEQADREEKAIKRKEQLALMVERRAELEQRVAEILERQNAALLAGYEASKPLIQALSDLQIQIATEEDVEVLDQLNEQLKEAGENLEKYFKNQLINAMMAEHGYSESIIDLAVKLGLLTKEAGETQKEFVKIDTEMDKLASDERFKDFHLTEQIQAFEDVYNGVKTAQEALEQYDPNAWKRDTPMGIIRSEEADWDIPFEVTMTEADEAKLLQIEERVWALTEPEEPHEVNIEPDDNFKLIYDGLDDLHKRLMEIIHDYKIKIKVEVVYPDYDNMGNIIPGSFASGGDFIVPQGYNNDNYLIGVTSGERVIVTTPGQMSQENSSGVTVALTNYFSAGVYDQAGVASSTKDGMYRALEELGLT